jgi:BolA protein
MSTIELIRTRLLALEPQQCDIIDDSEKHRGHAGALAGGGHYHIKIAAQGLTGLSQIAAHRAIYQCLGDLIPLPIHALQITIIKA